MKKIILACTAVLALGACTDIDELKPPEQQAALNRGEPVKIQEAGGIEVYKLYVSDGQGTDYETTIPLYIVPNATTTAPYSCGKTTCYRSVTHGAIPSTTAAKAALAKLTDADKAALGLIDPVASGLAKLTPEEKAALGVK